MATTGKIEVTDGYPTSAIQVFLEKVLATEEITALFVSKHMHPQLGVMPALIADAVELKWADPLAPAFPINGAKMISRLTRGLSGKHIAAVARPCEARAFVELAKLNQGNMDGVILIGVDCRGAFDNRTYRRFRAAGGDASPFDTTMAYLRSTIDDEGMITAFDQPFPLAKACRACEFPVATCTDLNINLLGHDIDAVLSVTAFTARGEGVLSRIGIEDVGIGNDHAAALKQLQARRVEYRDAMFVDTGRRIESMQKLAEYLSGCVNCYNCRAACPVCYCKECIFLTDVFDHKPWQYLEWAEQKGSLKLPTDTIFFHLTRLTHMSTACVGCGQCTNACPNDVPVMELFRTVARTTQTAFDYLPGRDPAESPPLSVFEEQEFAEVTDGGD